MLDEYTDEFGTDLESKIPEFNTPAPQGFIPPQQVYQQPIPQTQPQFSPPQQPVDPRYQPYQPQPQQPVYQYVYPPQQPPMQPVYAPAPQQPVPPQPMPAARINSVFAGESQELNELLKAEENSGCLKNLLFVLICLVVVVGSFGLSYMIGAKFILPGQRSAVPSFSVTKGLSKMKKLVSSQDVLKDEKAFAAPAPAAPKPAVPPEVQYAPPPAPKPPAPQPVASKPVVQPAAAAGTMYRVVVGAFDTKQEAADVAANVRADGFPVYQYMADGKYRLQIGAFKSKALATALMKKAGEYGYNAYISIK